MSTKNVKAKRAGSFFKRFLFIRMIAGSTCSVFPTCLSPYVSFF